MSYLPIFLVTEGESIALLTRCGSKHPPESGGEAPEPTRGGLIHPGRGLIREHLRIGQTTPNILSKWGRFFDSLKIFTLLKTVLRTTRIRNCYEDIVR